MQLTNNHLYLSRRNMIYKCTDMTYLDSRPVSDRDRACIDAWAKVSIYKINSAVTILFITIIVRVELKQREQKERDW